MALKLKQYVRKNNMENQEVDSVTQQILDSVKGNMISSFELGMKYKRLEVAESLINILRQNEFGEYEISIILEQAKLLEDKSYADIFTDIDNSNI